MGIAALRLLKKRPIRSAPRRRRGDRELDRFAQPTARASFGAATLCAKTAIVVAVLCSAGATAVPVAASRVNAADPRSTGTRTAAALIERASRACAMKWTCGIRRDFASGSRLLDVDFKSGRAGKRVISVTSDHQRDSASDVKVPWELSRYSGCCRSDKPTPQAEERFAAGRARCLRAMAGRKSVGQTVNWRCDGASDADFQLDMAVPRVRRQPRLGRS